MDRRRLRMGVVPMETSELARVIGPEVEALGFECVKVEVVGSRRSPIVRIYIDIEGGVTIKHCALVSRAVGLVLDRLDPFPGRYLLEVSSPGNNRPLTKPEHFARFVGKEARVQCREEGVGKKTYTGFIRSCINDSLVLDTDEGEKTIKLSDVIEANLGPQEYRIDKKMEKTKRRSRDEKGGDR